MEKADRAVDDAMRKINCAALDDLLGNIRLRQTFDEVGLQCLKVAKLTVPPR